MPRLWISQVNEDFDPDRDKAVGPYCFQGAEAVFAGWEDLDFSSSTDCSAKLMDSAPPIQRLMNAMVPRLADEFNEKHSVRYSAEYWRVLLIPWLVFLAPAIFMRVTQLQEIVDRFKDLDFGVHTVERPSDLASRDLGDMWHGLVNTHGFSHWLNSLILSEIAPENWILHKAPAAAIRPRPAPQPPGIVRHVVRRVRARLRCRRVYGVGDLTALFLSVYLSVLPKKPRRGQPAPPAPPAAPPEASARENFSPAFLKVLDLLVSCVVPDTLGKDFAAMDKRARGYAFRAGKINLVGPVSLVNEPEKFRQAHATLNGELFVSTQHGTQGFQLLPFSTIEVEYNLDAFFTWGWNNQNGYNGRFIALPAPMLSKRRDRHRQANASIFLVGTNSNPFDLRLHTTQSRGRRCAEDRREKLLFCESLRTEIQDNLIYRPYPKNPCDLEDVDYFSQKRPSMQIMDSSVSENALAGRLLRCKLLVTDHPGTTFVIALAANVPTIGFWNPQAWPLAPQAKEIFLAMESAGMIYPTGTKTAAAVNDIWDDVSGWWNDQTVQDARHGFCEKYGRTKRFWLPEWLAALRVL